jgi:multidrug resistance efflux pump
VSEKDLYRQKMQAQLDEWKAELDKIKAKAKKADADAKIQADKNIKELEGKIEDGQAKLKELADASGDAWVSLKGGVEDAWKSLKSGFEDAASKYK